MDFQNEKYEYLFQFWGADGETIAKELDITERTGHVFSVWFDTEEAREKFYEVIENIEMELGLFVAKSEEEGKNVRFRTIAKMILVLADCREYAIEYDFGFGYPDHTAHYMFFEGNYSCDCNKSIFIHQQYPEVAEMDCGSNIAIKDFEIIYKKGENNG